MRFLDPKTDFAFKKIFGSAESKPILIEFLNAQDNMDFIDMVEMAPGSTKSLVDIVAHGGGDIEMMSLDCQMHVAFLSEFFTLAYRLDSERFSILCNRAPRNLNPLGPETICNLLI